MLFQLAQENEIALNLSRWLNKKYSCKIFETFEKTSEIQLNNCKSCESGFINFANLAICCLLKTHEKYGTAYTNLYGAKSEVENFRQDAQIGNQWQIWAKNRVQAIFVVDIHKTGW